MRRTANMAVVTATTALLWALPAFAAAGNPGQDGNSAQRDECLLVAQVNCPNHIDSINDRIARLNHEIAKGTKAYSPEELKYLKKELNQYQAMHEYIDRNAPYGGY